MKKEMKIILPVYKMVYLYRTDFVTGIAEDRKKERVSL